MLLQRVISPLNLLLNYKQLQHLREIERETERKVERQGAATTVQSCEDREDEEGEFSYDGDLSDLSDQDDVLSFSLDTEGSVACNRATQAKPKMRSRQSQTTLGECRKCAERKMQVRVLQKRNGKLRSQKKKWKGQATLINVSAIFYFLFLVRKIESNSQIPLPNHQVILSCKTAVLCGGFLSFIQKVFFSDSFLYHNYVIV